AGAQVGAARLVTALRAGGRAAHLVTVRPTVWAWTEVVAPAGRATARLWHVVTGPAQALSRAAWEQTRRAGRDARRAVSMLRP
ncbi:hypothetical protein GT354_26455, partial [Streptomyces sp. SID3343]|nr:hypothetical protein [Streptomyces sp. SID3343]